MYGWMNGWVGMNGVLELFTFMLMKTKIMGSKSKLEIGFMEQYTKS